MSSSNDDFLEVRLGVVADEHSYLDYAHIADSQNMQVDRHAWISAVLYSLV